MTNMTIMVNFSTCTLVSLFAATFIMATVIGRSATLIAVYQVRCSILVVIRESLTARRLRLCYGVLSTPFKGVHSKHWTEDVDKQRINYALQVEHKHKMLSLSVWSLSLVMD